MWGTPVWSDEFNGTTIGPPDITRWNFDLGNNGGWGNNELEIYCGPPGYPNNPEQCPSTFDPATSNAYIDGAGHLVIQAIRAGNTWTSARLSTLTNPATTFQYGRIEAHEKLPVGAGLWPAFRAYGSNIQTVGWPASGEMDFMENLPATAGLGPTVIASILQGPGYSSANALSNHYTFPAGDVTSVHTYGAIWSPFMVQFYVDDPANVFYIGTASDTPIGTSWAFNHPFVILTNLAVGGNLPGPPDDTTPNPAAMIVDYVRYYQAAPVAPPNLGNPAPISYDPTYMNLTTTAYITAVSGSGRMYLNCTVTSNYFPQTCYVDTGNPLNHNVVDFSSTNYAAVNITVDPVQSSTLNVILAHPTLRHWPFQLLISIGLAGLALQFVRRNGRRKWKSATAFMILIFAGTLLVECCGGKSGYGPSDCQTGADVLTLNAYTVSGNGLAPDATVTIPEYESQPCPLPPPESPN